MNTPCASRGRLPCFGFLVFTAIDRKSTRRGCERYVAFKRKVTRGKKKKGWIEIRPRFKIQYPMKNRGENIRVNTEKQE
jgi:hypothetical protein